MKAIDTLPLDVMLTISLEKQGVLPLYRQLYEGIREAILSGRFKAGVKLPSTRRFAAVLNISRNTVVYAYDQLLAEGFVEGRRGSGSFVAKTLQIQTPKPWSPVDQPWPNSVTNVKLSLRGEKFLLGQERMAATQPKPLTHGIPDLALFPMDRWSRLISRHWRQASPKALAYGNPKGLEALRVAIADYLNACRGVRCDADQVLVLAGAQPALDLAGRLLLDPGDPVWMEEPGYRGARGAFLAGQALCIGVPVDHEGLNVERGHQLCPSPKLIYVTPSHQYPSGATMSLPRRLTLLEYAAKNGSWILEDDYDSEYRYEGRPLAALQGLAKHDRVIYMGTFSKVLFPSLRLGYMVAPRSLIDAFCCARTLVDGQTPTVIQGALAEFIQQGSFTSHLRKMRVIYHRRQQRCLQLLRDHCSQWLHFRATEGGMHLPVYFKDDINDERFSQKAREWGLHVKPLSGFYMNAPKRSGLILGYAGYDRVSLESAIKTLANLLAQTDP